MTNFMGSIDWLADGNDYWRDTARRSILFTDILRQRGNIYLEHLQQGQPPVLVFDYEMIMDGTRLDRPANYALVRIVDRRNAPPSDDQPEPPSDSRERRHQVSFARDRDDTQSRPIIIFDPRAGHGPGIGGSKQDSQIGMALDAGHPVYFLIFYTDPVAGQTLADVRNVQIKFVEEVRRRHPKAPKPAIIGNCQGGWAAALVGAERPDLVGPMVFNGSPLSYWGGVVGVNPMRYLGGLWGGVWVNSFLSDLGDGIFDGANLVGNFELLNPANTLWTKQYNVYANVDTEAERYLNFEKWWGGFFLLTDKEIHQIVDGLFVGNQLERGEFELDHGRKVDLRSNHNPVVVFASFGDNITPPQQAFNWIVKTYGTVEEIQRRGQVIVCIGHSRIGHLGIFVSAKIARKEHKKIINSFEILEFLPPGLYAMDIEEDEQNPGEYLVNYTEKQMKDILALDDGLEDEAAFYPVREISKANDQFYQTFISPWVKLASNAYTASFLRQMHPMRVQRYLFSDLNPWMQPVKEWADQIKSANGPAQLAEDNVFRQMEQSISDGIVNGLNWFRDWRDSWCEQTFKSIYENPWLSLFYPADGARAVADSDDLETLRRQDANQWRRVMTEGGFAEAMVRIFFAIGLADRQIQRKGYQVMERLVRENSRMASISHEEMQHIVRTQARILQTDTDQAIDTLMHLLPAKQDRQEALALIKKGKDLIQRDFNTAEQAVLQKIMTVLKG